MKYCIHEVATAFNSISQFAFSALSEVSEFCVLELENLSLELSSQLWDSKRPGKSENADYLKIKWIHSSDLKGESDFLQRFVPEEQKGKDALNCFQILLVSLESFITLSAAIGKPQDLMQWHQFQQDWPLNVLLTWGCETLLDHFITSDSSPKTFSETLRNVVFFLYLLVKKCYWISS